MRRPASLVDRLAIWRDAVLTTAAFTFVLAAVIGIGPFKGPSGSTGRTPKAWVRLDADPGTPSAALVETSR